MRKITSIMQLQVALLTFLFTNSINAQVGIGTLTPAANLSLEVASTGNNDAIYGHSNNVGGYLGREINITVPDLFGGPAQTILGSGVYANNPTAGYTSMFSQSTGAATVAASINYSDVWISSYNFVNNASSAINPPSLYAQLNTNSTTLGGYKTAFSTFSSRAGTTGNPGYTLGGVFTSVAQNEDAYGISAAVFSDRTGNNSNTDLAGGEFLVFNYAGTLSRSQAWVANYLDLGPPNHSTDLKIIGTGVVSTIVEDEANTPRVMFAPEAPEVLFQDYGVGQLQNGVAHIAIDPILTKNIIVDSEHPLKVFIQLEGDCNGVFVTNKSSTGFTVKELQNGQSNTPFSYQIVANRIDRNDNSLMSASSFQDLRFPKLNQGEKIKIGKKIKKEERELANQISKKQ